MIFVALSMALVTATGTMAFPSDPVADAQRKCTTAASGPAPAPMVQRPVEKFDDCIVTEANKWPSKTRKAICALGKSGGPSGSTVEVYMAKGQCRTDYE